MLKRRRKREREESKRDNNKGGRREKCMFKSLREKVGREGGVCTCISFPEPVILSRVFLISHLWL